MAMNLHTIALLLEVGLGLLSAAACLQGAHSLSFTSRSTTSRPAKIRLVRHATTCTSGRQQHATATCYSRKHTMTMRDASSAYWFTVGDSVRVVDDVIKAGCNLRGRVGTVTETWEKCNVDPTCCCAEQVDVGMAVRVQFQVTEQSQTDRGADNHDSSSFFLHYFAEDELIKVSEATSESSKTDEEMPFDGMSCKAFKLEQLQMGEQARRIAAYEESKRESLE